MADDDGVPAQVVDWIGQTDTLLFILDVERLVYSEEFRDDAVGDETILIQRENPAESR